jgi:hypothetical protein
MILEQLVINGYDVVERSGFLNVSYLDDDRCDLETLIEIMEFIDTLDLPTSSRKAYAGINEESLFLNIATVIKAASDVKMYDMINRDVFDKVDHIISLNKPLETNSYREHIVPCTMILQEAFRMYDEDKASTAEVAAMIQQNLFIVHITKSEANYIDVDLGLKTTMPDGWKFGDSVFARLEAAGINY